MTFPRALTVPLPTRRSPSVLTMQRPRSYADRAFARYRHTQNPSDLETVVRETSRPLYSKARSLTRDAYVAEELVQSTFIAAVDGAEDFDPNEPVMPWLIGILKFRALRERRSATRAPDPNRVRRELPIPDPSDVAYQREFVDTVRRTIAGLPSTYAKILELHVMQGLSPLEVARALDRDRSTVRTQIARGLQRLRTNLLAETDIAAIAS